MNIRYTTLGLLAAIVILIASGCTKSPTIPTAPKFPDVSGDTVARVHWLGKKKLALNADAYYLMRLWQLPESRRVEAQTLVKLSTAPWRLKFGEAAAQNSPASLLGPLLEDIIQEECYFELRGTTNDLQELVFAIHLDETRAGLWRTNLVAIIATLNGIQTMDVLDNGRGWALKQAVPPNRFELSRVGEWTILGIGQEKNVLLQDVLTCVKFPTNSPARTPENWVQMDFNLQRLRSGLARMFNVQESALPAMLPRLSIGVSGDGGNLLTRGKLMFPEPLQFDLEPWNIPTNLIHEPLASFVALRGMQSWLSALPVWTNRHLGTPPSQCFAWTPDGVPLQASFAAPLSDSRQVQGIMAQLLKRGNDWLAARSVGQFQPTPDGGGIVWSGLPLVWSNVPPITPFFTAAQLPQGIFLYAGTAADGAFGNNTPPPDGMFQDIISRTNLLWYDWEVTGPRLESDLFLGQVLRVAVRREQMPLDTAAALWLRAIVPRVSSCTTVLSRSGPDELSFIRKSTVGFNALELHLLADWLESPQFPRGLHTTLAQPVAPATERR